ncbi:tannase and feruloyl esterase [Pyrenochaeta sp. DS3sAY3a]|nr:tannase and feruloyl esterase [Pyrenochaeta sp. DS3sAY3a]
MRLSLLTLSLQASAALGSQQSERTPRCGSEHFQIPETDPGVKILSIEAKVQENYSTSSSDPQGPLLGNLNFCQVKVYLTHQSPDHVSATNSDPNDKVLVEVWLPLTREEWNGRFQATGGGGYVTGAFAALLEPAIRGGWAATSTDGGHSAERAAVVDASWMLNKDKSLNWNLIHNFASRSLVDQIRIGKSITEQYFKQKPHHSYWNGCSTGGRQGYAIAQRYPGLVDGILANAPAISFSQLVTAEFWPQLRMKMLDTYMSNCELEHYRARTIQKCDSFDGVFDGILEDPEECDFDAHTLVAENDSFECEGETVKFTTEMAQLMIDIHNGPRTQKGALLYPGLAYGVPMTSLANITISASGLRAQNPFPISASWLKNVLLKDPAADLSLLDMDSYMELFGQAGYELGGLLNTDSPDLSALRDSGTKLLTWHGTYDPLIPYQNTVAYRRRVEGVMGGANEVDKYYRLFLAPGVGHCGRGLGPSPRDPLSSLVDWVETDYTPETLEAETIDHEGHLVTRDLCVWPGQSKYMGIGDAKRASSWSCVDGTERAAPIASDAGPGRAQRILGNLADRLEGLGLGLKIG